jgi:hypothetical protein
MPADTDTTRNPQGDFPPPQFPTVFADAVGTLANSPTTVKFFLSRFEPSFAGDGRSQLQPFAQVVMPMDGFAATFVFFEAQLRTLVQAGYISEQRLAELREIFAASAKP